MAMMSCIEDIQRSLEHGYYGGRGTAGSFRSGLVGTQSAVSRLFGCLNQLEYIARDTWRIGQSMYYSGVGLWGSVSFHLYKTKPEREITGTETICKGEYVRYKAKNWCKVILDQGSDARWIEIRNEEGKDCTKVSIISPESCYNYYGGYGYGSWGWGWSNTYRPMYQPPGTTESQFLPTGLCGDRNDEPHTYQVYIPGVGAYYTLNYDPNC